MRDGPSSPVTVKLPPRTEKAERRASWTVTFPWSCAVPVNARLAPGRGRLRLSARYRNALAEAVGLAMMQLAGTRPDGASAFRVTMRVHLPDRRRRDLDGLAKLPLDAMEGYLYEDDTQVRDVRIVDAGLDREAPRLVLEIERADS